MSRYAFFLAILLIVDSSALLSQPQVTRTPLQELRAADRALANRDYHRALDHWTAARSARATASWNLHLDLKRAELERELRLYTTADERLNDVIRTPSAAEIEAAAWIQKGLLALQQNNYGWARYCLNTAIEVAETEAGRVAHDLAGTAYYWIGLSHITEPGRPDYKLAVDALAASVKGYPTLATADDALFAIGQIEESLGRFDAALQRYERIEHAYPTSEYAIPAAIRAAQCHLLAGNPSVSFDKSTEVREQIDRSLTAQAPETSQELRIARDECNLTRGTAALTLKRYADAEASFLQLAYEASTGLKREGALGLADTYLAAGRADSALALYTRLRAERTDDAVGRAARIRVGLALRQLNTGSGAVELLTGIASDTADVMRDEALLEVGRIHYLDREFTQAAAVLAEAAETTARSRIRIEASTLLGLALLANGELEAAATVLDTTDAAARAIAASVPNGITDMHHELRLTAAVTLIHANRPGDAIPKLNDLVLNAPGYARNDAAYYWLGEAYYRTNLLPAAITAMETLVERYPQSEYVELALYTTGWARFRTGACRQAEASFAQLVKAYPLSRYAAEAELRRGDCMYLLGQNNSAVDHYTRAIVLDSSRGIARHALYQSAIAQFAAERYTDALASLEAYRTQFPTEDDLPDVLYRKAETEYRMRNPHGAIETLYTLIRTHDTSRLMPRTFTLLGRSYEAAGQSDAAYAAHSIVIGTYPTSSIAAEASADLDRLEHRARRVDDAGSPTAPTPAARSIGRGAIFREAHWFDRALGAYHDALAQAATDDIGAEALLGVLRTHIAAGSTDRGLDTLRVLLPQYSTNATMPAKLFGVAGDLLARGDSTNGRTLLELIRRVYPTSEESWNATILAATIRAMAGQRDTARLMLIEQVAHAAESQRGVRLALAMAELDMATGNFDDAFARLERLSQRTDDVGAEALYRLGRCYALQGRFEEAAVTFAEVIDRYLTKSPWNGHARYSLGESYEQMGLTDRAREIYREIVTTNGSSEVRDAAKTRLDSLSGL